MSSLLFAHRVLLNDYQLFALYPLTSPSVTDSRLQTDQCHLTSSSPVSMSVQSKNLFNFPPQGSYDKDVIAYMEQQKLMMKEMFGEENPLLK